MLHHIARYILYLSTKIPAKLILDFGTLLVSQHERPQHEAPHIYQIEQGLIYRMLLHAMAAANNAKMSRHSCQYQESCCD